MVDAGLLLPSPRSNQHRNEMWVDEQIWGHRLWDSQSAWLLFLEFLNVAEACHREGRLLDEQGSPHPLRYRPHKRLYLRNILFNNETMIQIAERFQDSGTAWSQWLATMEEEAMGVRPSNFSYLRKRLGSFHDFASLISMLRASAVESDRDRRWGSRFVFPFGPNALYEDLNIKPNGSVSREYINFGRTGELLYMMLCRSRHANELRPYLERMIEGRNPWNALIGLLEPDDEEDLHRRGEDSYLPYRSHPVFDRLAEDWLRVFELRLPGFDAFPSLVTLATLYIMLYKLTLAADWCGKTQPVSFVCEVVAPKKTLVRELSVSSYQQNNQLSAQAVEACLRRITESEEWRRTIGESDAFSRCRNILEREVHWPRESDDYQGCNDPAELFARLRHDAVGRHRQHVANVHRNYGRDAGLISKRGTNQLRYAPTDAILKTLILANVHQRMEYKEFLALLFSRYGLVFGEREAEHVLVGDDFEESAFQANAERLEHRLTSLGMLRRLSDACAYVLNPFGGTQS